VLENISIQRFESVKWMVKMMEIRWINSDVNRPDGADERRRRRR